MFWAAEKPVYLLDHSDGVSGSMLIVNGYCCLESSWTLAEDATFSL